ncbi:hypothetical protein B0O99DRAFT_48036 [Bisporella sp. PMI_857]|nr:hypothetical protein B0O99DRAFT_48036 [Bisporella sp. PMI_857]
MSTSVLSAEEHSVSRILRKCKKMDNFLEPESLYFTTPVERVGQPTASSRDCTTKFTLATKGERGRIDKTRHGGHDGKNLAKHKGRPRLSPVYSTEADKRRTQIRLAQRAFRLRQETKIQLLENQVLNMENAISQTTKVLLDFEGKILASGVLDQAPEISHRLRVTVETLSLTKASTGDQDSDNKDGENVGGKACSPAKALEEVEDGVTSVDRDAIVSQHPPFKHGSERTARDRTAQFSVIEYIQRFHQNQQPPSITLPCGVPQAIHQMRSDENLNCTTVCEAAQTSSSVHKDEETDPGYIKDTATEEPDSGTVDATPVNDKSVWEVKATTINALRKEKSTLRKATGPRARDRDVPKHPLGMRYPLAPSTSQRMSKTSIYDVFLEKFLDAFATVAPSGRVSPDCLRVAAEVRHSSPTIYNVILSVSATYFGSSIGDSRIVFAAQKLYVNVLKVLQNALLSPGQCTSLSTLLTVILAIHYELLQNTSEKSMVNHILGASKLIEFRGPQSHISGPGHLCFTNLRNYLITTAIGCRTPTFLAKEEWKTIPWSISPKGFVQHLLDVMADIPTLLAYHDSLKSATKANSISRSQMLGQRTILQASVADIEYRLHKWKIEHTDPISGPSEFPGQGEVPRGLQSPLASDTQFPIFRCRDQLSGELISPTAITYPEPELARALLLYYSALLTISFVDMRTEGKLGPYEQYRLACLICRSIEYSIRAVPNHATRVMGPLRAAFDALPEGGVERQWVQDVFLVIRKAEHMKWATSFAKDFSIQTNAS